MTHRCMDCGSDNCCCGIDIEEMKRERKARQGYFPLTVKQRKLIRNALNHQIRFYKDYGKQNKVLPSHTERIIGMTEILKVICKDYD